MYNYTDKSYLKEALDNKYNMQSNTNKAYIKMMLTFKKKNDIRMLQS